MSTAVAIVGAGAAGAGAAYALRDAPATVTVFEERPVVSGRAATRRRRGCVYDHGASYVKPTDERVSALLTDVLDAEGLVDVADPVWTFDADGEIAPGRDADDHKWTYVEGLDRLGERLLAATDAGVVTDTRVAELLREDGGWRLRDAHGDDLGWFDAVVCTPPAPQTADLLGAANWEHRFRRDLREAVAVVPYRTIVSAVLHYPFELARPYYALVNADKGHDLGWLAREECKAGHVPDGESLLIAQPSPGWSVDNYDRSDGALADAAAEKVAALLADDRLAAPDWTDVQRWRYALPDAAADPDTLARAAAHDLYFAGDWVASEGRIHAALASGLDAGERVSVAR
ncbi:MAG: NAD(P)/FAD-dependent oxidoreductase [Haloarculaceae archaeon]